jgi:hypothetical protein
VEHLAGRTDAAAPSLEAADAIAVEVAAGPDSELGVSLARVRSLLSN